MKFIYLFRNLKMKLDVVKLKEIKPALTGYVSESQALLKLSPIPGEEAVHDIRVLMKKSRAVLKLAATQLDQDSYERDIRAFREVGRLLCSWRESSVHRKVLKELRKENPALFLKLQENEKLEVLMKKELQTAEPSEELSAGLEQITDLLNKAGYRIRFQSMDRIDPHILLKELELSYTRVSEKYLTCRNKPKACNMHEFRKLTKDFLYQLCFFRPLNPSAVKTLEKKLENLTRDLGKFNDLSQLIKALGYKYSEGKNLPAMDELIVRIREKQDRHLAKVWPVAYKIFCPGQQLVNMLGFKLLVI
jgi:CHAD domain-containing protein